MANNGDQSIFSFLIIFTIFLSFSVQALGAGRDIPKNSDMKQPNWFVEHDGTVLIPGFGRVVIPPKGFNPFTYNPITGTNTGTGSIIPDPGTGGGAGGAHIPGGDDTLVPNPGAEVPAAPTGSIPAPPSRH